jgi:hypothetical protein
MASSRKYKITAYLEIHHAPKSAVLEPIHAALANVNDTPKAFEQFIKRWGLDDDLFAQLSLAKKLVVRDRLRAAWRDDESVIQLMHHSRIPVFLFPVRDGIKFEPQVWFQTVDLLFLRDHQAGKTAICANKDCPSPYFIRKRKTQKFCETGPCVKQSLREKKREWWNRNRGKGAN